MELTTIKTFDNPMEAHIVKSRLESEGITCFLFDEHMVSLNPLYNVTVGGIKLKINHSDYEKARTILVEVEQSPVLDDSNHEISCPNCASNDLINGYKSMKGSTGFFSAIISLLLMVFPIYYKTVYKCKSCDTEFRPDEIIKPASK